MLGFQSQVHLYYNPSSATYHVNLDKWFSTGGDFPPQGTSALSEDFKKKKNYLFIWLCWVLVAARGIFVAAWRMFSCGMQDLVP